MSSDRNLIATWEAAWKANLLLTTIFLVVMGTATSSQSQGYSAEKEIGPHSSQVPAYLQHTGIEQHLGKELPLSELYTDETGSIAPMAKWTAGRPTIIVLLYYNCIMLCPEVLHGLATALHDAHLVPGKAFSVIAFSIAPSDNSRDAATAKQKFISTLGLPNSDGATHFLTGSSKSIQAIASSTGFEYVRVPGPDGSLSQFAHASVIMFATPEGKLSRYIAGVQYPSRDVRLALAESSNRRISNPVELALIYCCNYDPAVGRYSVAILRIMSIAGMLTLLGIGVMLYTLRRSVRPLSVQQ